MKGVSCIKRLRVGDEGKVSCIIRVSIVDEEVSCIMRFTIIDKRGIMHYNVEDS